MMPRRNATPRRRQRTTDVLHATATGSPTGTFRCLHCRFDVPLLAPGTAHRNHCPQCLTSRHVDSRRPGDRAESCRGRMLAISVSVRDSGEWALIHHCLACGAVRSNRIAGDDNAVALMRIAVRPLADSQVGRRALLAL